VVIAFHSRTAVTIIRGHIWYRLYDDFPFCVLCLLVVDHDEVQVVRKFASTLQGWMEGLSALLRGMILRAM